MPLNREIVGVLVVGMGLTGTAVHAQTSPYYVGVEQAFSYESNVFNLEDTSTPPLNVQGVSDVISITSLNGGIDQPFGRQRFYATGNVAYNKYRTNSQLDNTSYGLDAGLDWATVERLTGKLAVAANRGLTNFNLYTDDPQNYQQNIQDTQQALATLNWGLTPRVALDLGYVFRNVTMSNDQAKNNEYRQNTAIVGLSYSATNVLTAGVAARFSKTDFPYYRFSPPLADEADGRNVDLFATWVPSGLSELEARLSYTDVTHTENIANDYQGMTGTLRWTYKPTGKLTTRLSLIAVPGTGAAFSDFTGNATPFVANSRYSTMARLGATYLATGKIEINAFASFEKDRLTQQNLDGSIEKGSAVNTRLQIGATYSPTRNIDLLCSYRYEARSTDSDLTSPYSGNIFLCSAELLLR
jgi:hypothetical protein